MRSLLVGPLVALLVLSWTVSSVAAQGDCHWIGQGEALLCGTSGGFGPTVSAWQGSGWTTVPAGSGLFQPAVGGGLSTYGRSYPPSAVTPAAGYSAQNATGNTLTQTTTVYGPGSTSRTLTCTSWYSGYASGAAYQTCR
jgi:hypothetical protein